MHLRHLARVLFIAWLLLIAAVSVAPLRAKTLLGTTGPLHGPIHFLVFGGTSLLALFTAPSLLARTVRTAALILFCTVTEMLEAIFYHNPFEWRDLAIDSLALGFGWLLLVLFRRPALAAQ